MIAGSLMYDTQIDTKGFKKGLNSIEDQTKSAGTTIKNIVAGLGITKIISKAIDVINSSLDGAIDRLDTLNNFPKVMDNLGIDSKESSQAIQDLSDGLKGLPTTLNDGALAVQRFTSKNGDVKKSVSLFLAVNNAILAGGAGTQIQASALEQLSQAYAKGKPDMMEWRTIQMAMPAQLKQIAKHMLGNKDALAKYMKKAEEYADKNPLSSTGKELLEQFEAVKAGSGDMTTALGTALRTGVISMDEFVDAITAMNTNGSGEFKSFQEQAKNATGGIQTSITNAKTAVTRGVSKIVDEIDKSLKNEGFGGISGVISNMGKIAEKALNGIAKWMGNLIPTLKKVFEWLSKHQKLVKVILGLITSVVASMVAYKVAIKAINALNVAKGIWNTVSAFISLIPEIKSAKDAMTLLNMATGKNPFALVVAGITTIIGLTAAFVAACSQVDEELKKTVEEADNQQQSWKDLKEAREEALRTNGNEIAVTQQLADELRTITDENGKVKEGYESRAKYILGELNKALGTEYKLNGDIVEGYKDITENVDKLIAKKKAEIALEAYREEYTKALTGQKEAVKELLELEKQLEKIKETDASGLGGETAKQAAIEATTKKIEEQKNMIGEYGYTIEKYDQLTVASTEGSKEKIEQALDDLQVSYNATTANNKTALLQQISDQQETVESIKKHLQEAKDNNDKYQEQIYQKQLEVSEKELTALKQNMNDQTQVVQDGTLKQVKSANENWDKVEMANRLVEEIHSMQETLDKDDTNSNGAVKAVYNLTERIATTFQTNTQKAYQWGQDYSKNMSSGISSGMSLIDTALGMVTGKIKSMMGHSVPKEGPLKRELTWMPDMMQNLAKGIEANKYKVTRAIGGLTADMQNKMKNAVNVEVGNANASATVKSNYMYNSIIQLNAKFDGDVIMDEQKAGRILAPEISKAIKVGGLD